MSTFVTGHIHGLEPVEFPQWPQLLGWPRSIPPWEVPGWEGQPAQERLLLALWSRSVMSVSSTGLLISDATYTKHHSQMHNISALYLWGPHIKFWPGGWLFWDFQDFLRPSGYALVLLGPLVGASRFCANCYSLTITSNKPQYQSPRKPNSSSARKKILHILWNPKIHYCVHNSPPLLPLMNQINPVHTAQSIYVISILLTYSNLNYVFKVNFIFQVCPPKSCMHFCLSCATSPTPFTLFYMITWIIFGEQYKLWSSSSCSFLQPPAISSLLDPNTFRCTLSFNTVSLLQMAKFHTHIKQQAKWQFCIFESLYAYLENGGQKYFEPNDSRHSMNSICS